MIMGSGRTTEIGSCGESTITISAVVLRENALGMCPAILAPKLELSNVLLTQCLIFQHLLLHPVSTSNQKHIIPSLAIATPALFTSALLLRGTFGFEW
jgi:hypothetical protein